jgi:hypothetical protein
MSYSMYTPSCTSYVNRVRLSIGFEKRLFLKYTFICMQDHLSFSSCTLVFTDSDNALSANSAPLTTRSNEIYRATTHNVNTQPARDNERTVRQRQQRNRKYPKAKNKFRTMKQILLNWKYPKLREKTRNPPKNTVQRNGKNLKTTEPVSAQN